MRNFRNIQRRLIQQFQQRVALLFDLSANPKVLSHMREEGGGNPSVPLFISSGCGIKCGEFIFFGPSGLNSLSKCLHDPNKIRAGSLAAIRCLRASKSQKLLIQIAKVGAQWLELEF